MKLIPNFTSSIYDLKNNKIALRVKHAVLTMKHFDFMLYSACFSANLVVKGDYTHVRKRFF